MDKDVPPGGYIADDIPPGGYEDTDIPPGGYEKDKGGVASRLLAPVKAAVSAPQKLAKKIVEPIQQYEKVLPIALAMVIEDTPMAATWRLAKKGENMSREALNAAVEMIPDAQTGSPVANMAINTPKTVGKVIADFAPTFIAPETIALAGAGPLAGAAIKSRAIAGPAKWAWANTPTKIKELLVYRFGEPAGYQRAAELANLAKQSGGEEAATIGKALSDLKPAQQERVGQIVRGSIITSEKELGLRLRAAYARTAIDSLEAEAKDLGLLPATTLNQLGKAERAELRTRIGAINERIQEIKNHGQSVRDSLKSKAETLRIQGATGVVRSVESAEQAVVKLKEMIDATKERIAGNQFAGVEELMAQDAMRRTKTQWRLLERFEKSSVGDQEKLFSRLAIAANRAGVKIDDIYERGLSIGGFKGLLSRIESASTNFPQKRKMLNELSRVRDDIQKRLADSYRVSGQKYMPRLYLDKELPKVDAQFGFSSNKIRQDRFKGRMDLPEEARISMGEITKPAYPVAKGLAQVTDAVENARLFRTVASNPAWATGDEVAATAKGWTQLPKTKALGKLSGKFVDPYIAKDINSIVAVKGEAQKIYEQGLSLWKYGKVILNPATHFRNMMSNSILMDLGGVDLSDQPRLLVSAAKELMKKGSVYQEAKQAGLLGNEFFGGEIKAFRDALIASDAKASTLSRMLSVSKRVGNKAGALYQSEEQLFKLAKFIDNKHKGMSVEEAVKDAEKWLFNYAKVPKAVDFMRKAPIVGAPFITFVSKAMPRVVEAAIANPLSVYKYHALFNAIEGVAKEKLGISESDFKMIKRGTRGQSVVLPMKDKNGDPLVLDLSYILPWGDIGEMGGFAGLPPAVLMGGPLKTFLELGFNKSLYRDSPIWKATDTTSMKAGKISDYFLKAMLPTLTPGVEGVESPFRGGYSYEKLRAAAKGEPSFPFGSVQSKALSVMDTMFGIKIKPSDLTKLKIKAAMEAEQQATEAQSSLTFIERHKGISDNYKAKAKQDFEFKIQRITNELKRRIGLKD